MPANTGIDLPAEVAALLADHPNVIGMKDSGGDIAKIGMMSQLTRGKDFQANENFHLQEIQTNINASHSSFLRSLSFQ